MPYLLLALAIVCEVVATSALRSSAGLTRLGPSVVVLVGYALAFALLAKVVEQIPLGVAYAIWSGVGIVLVALVAWGVHGQRPDAAAWVGFGLIVAGAAVLNLGSSMSVR